MHKKILALFGLTLILVMLWPQTALINAISPSKVARAFQPAKACSDSQPEIGQAVDTDWWLMFHHDTAHDGYSSSTAPKTNYTLWKSPYKTNGYVDSSPAVAGGVVYIGSNDYKVYAINASSGALVWSYKTNGTVDSSPAVAGGVVYVGSQDGKVYALNATTGTPVWKSPYPTGGPIVHSSPAVAGGVVYIGSNDAKVYAINASSGALVWSYKTNGTVDSSPAVVNGVVYVGSTDDNVYALNATTSPIPTTKRLLWNYTTGGNVYSSPAVANGVVYIGSWDGIVYAINATTHTPVWKYTTGSIIWYSSPAVANGVVYVGSRNGKVYALNATPPTPAGALVWNNSTGGLVDSSPAVANGTVYVGSNDGKVYALNAATGDFVWNYSTGGPVDSSPAVANGTVYVGSEDDKVYAFGTLPQTVTISPSSATLDVGQSLVFTSKRSGGLPPYSYEWYLNGAPVSGATGSSWNFTPSSSGSYLVYVRVNCSVGESPPSPTSNVTVNAALKVAISPNVAWIYLGQSQTFTSKLNLTGTPPYRYYWYLNTALVPGATSGNWTFTPSSTGTYQIYVKVTDNVSASAQSSNAQLTVNPSPAWPMFHENSMHTGYSSSSPPTTNQTLWSYSTGGTVDSCPAVVGGIVYVGSNDRYVYALNATTGIVVWRYKTNGIVSSSPAVANGVVYVGSEDRNVYALNASTGTLIWNYTTGKLISHSSPIVAGGIVYVGSYDGKVYALNASTGASIWNYTTLGTVYSSPAVAGGGFLYVGSTDDNVYALDAAMGTYVRNYTTGSFVYSSPAVALGRVFVGSWDDKVYALDANSRTVLWSYLTGGAVDSSPAIAAGVVYIGSEDHKVYALNATTTTATGKLVWSYLTGGAVDSSPAVAGGVVYVGSKDGKVYALNASTGTLMWSYKTGNPVDSSPAVAAGVVYIGSGDYIYAIGLSPNPDVAVADVKYPKSVVGQGYSLCDVLVTVANVGNTTETFNVTEHANGTAIASWSVAMSSGISAIITFNWNTTGFKFGNYTISAYASPVPGETNTANNNFTGGTVKVTIPGDLNGDGTVDLTDFGILQRAWGSSPGSSNWDPRADINNDGVVDLIDFGIMQRNWGRSLP